MNKKLGIIALTGALTFGVFGTPGIENSPFSYQKVEATMPDGVDLKVSPMESREVGANVAGVVWLQDKTVGGTVVFKLKPTAGSKWDGKKLLDLQYSTLTNFQNRTEPAASYLEKDGERYVRVYIYFSNPSKARELYLFTNNGEFGKDPIEYEAVFVPGKDLTANEPPVSQPKPKKVIWKGAELKKGQIGKIDVTKPINLWKRDGNKLTYVRVLQPGENYRVYSYDSKFGGQYGLGGGYYITNMKGYITYKTPSKAKLAELNNN